MVSGGMSCVKYLLFAFNLVFVIFGILLLYAGFSTVAKIGDYNQLLEGAPNNAAISLIIVGFAIFLLAFLGCCGAIKENSCMLSTFSSILLVILLIEVIGAGLVFAFKSKLKDAAKEGIDKIISEYDFNKDDDQSAVNKVIDDLQHNLGCCGAKDYKDWTNLRNDTEKLWPWSCCSQEKDQKHDNCTVEHVINKDKGCVDALDKEIRGSFGMLGGIAIAIAVIQLIGIIFACTLSRTIRKEYEVV